MLWASFSTTYQIFRAQPLYYVLGQTLAGRHLFCVVIQFPDGKGYPVTARPMTPGEKKRYNKWKKP